MASSQSGHSNVSSPPPHLFPLPLLSSYHFRMSSAVNTDIPSVCTNVCSRFSIILFSGRAVWRTLFLRFPSVNVFLTCPTMHMNARSHYLQIRGIYWWKSHEKKKNKQSLPPLMAFKPATSNTWGEHLIQRPGRPRKFFQSKPGRIFKDLDRE